MSVLNSNDIARIDAIAADMTQRSDVQRSLFVNGRNVGFITRYKKSGRYHVYTDGGCVSMQNSARGLYDYLNIKFPGWDLQQGQRSH